MRLLFVLLLGFPLALPSVSAAAADPAKVWHGVLSEDPPSLDPAGPTNTSAEVLLELIFDRLLTYDYLARPAKLVPLAAAAMPEASNDGKTWTVRLKQGILFTPDPAFKGVKRELTAQDFVYSLKRFLDPKVRSPNQFLFRDKFVGLDEVAKAAETSGRFDYDVPVEGLQAVDRYTLRFELKSPDRRFPYLLAHANGGVLAREVVEAYGAAIGDHPVGTGPYVLSSKLAGTRYVLDANPLYRKVVWDFAAGSDPRDRDIVKAMRGKTIPQIGHVELSIIEEDSSYWLTFLNGKLDTVVPAAAVPGSLARERGAQAGAQGQGPVHLPTCEPRDRLRHIQFPRSGGRRLRAGEDRAAPRHRDVVQRR